LRWSAYNRSYWTLPTFRSIFVKSYGTWVIFVVPKGFLLILAYWLELRGTVHHSRLILLVTKINRRINLLLSGDCLQKDRSTIIVRNVLYRVIQNDCRGFNNLSYTIHLVLQMQRHVISFYGVTSRIRFMILLFPQVSQN